MAIWATAPEDSFLFFLAKNIPDGTFGLFPDNIQWDQNPVLNDRVTTITLSRMCHEGYIFLSIEEKVTVIASLI